MCLAIPSQVLQVDGLRARVTCFGQERDVSLMLLLDPVVPGDYVLVRAGGFVYAKVDAQQAQEALALMRELLDHEERGAATR